MLTETEDRRPISRFTSRESLFLRRRIFVVEKYVNARREFGIPIGRTPAAKSGRGSRAAWQHQVNLRHNFVERQILSPFGATYCVYFPTKLSSLGLQNNSPSQTPTLISLCTNGCNIGQMLIYYYGNSTSTQCVPSKTCFK